MKMFLARLFCRPTNRPMTCGEVGELLQFYLDGELDEPRSTRLAAHLKDCRRPRRPPRTGTTPIPRPTPPVRRAVSSE
jgi:hypothetical protein